MVWVGDNFNQIVKHVDELMIANELVLPYFEKVLYPQIVELQKLLTAVKQERHQIAERLTRQSEEPLSVITDLLFSSSHDNAKTQENNDNNHTSLQHKSPCR